MPNPHSLGWKDCQKKVSWLEIKDSLKTTFLILFLLLGALAITLFSQPVVIY